MIFIEMNVNRTPELCGRFMFARVDALCNCDLLSDLFDEGWP